MPPKPEKQIMNILFQNGVPFSFEHSFPESKRIFDFYIPMEPIPLMIEYDGQQHFFKTFETCSGKAVTLDKRKQIDIEKTKEALNNGCHVLRIPYTCSDNLDQVLHDFFDFLDESEFEKPQFFYPEGEGELYSHITA